LETDDTDHICSNKIRIDISSLSQLHKNAQAQANFLHKINYKSVFLASNMTTGHKTDVWCVTLQRHVRRSYPLHYQTLYY